jgi:uncharacterized protein
VSSTPTYVFDAWAWLAWLQRERPAFDKVAELLDKAEREEIRICTSIVNAGEVYYRLAKTRGQREAGLFRERLPVTPVSVISIHDDDVVWTAADLKAAANISYADSFAASLARRLDADLVTGDPEMRHLEGIRVCWLERKR